MVVQLLFCDINSGICVLPASFDCVHLSQLCYLRFRGVISLEVFKPLRTVLLLSGILSLDWNFWPFFMDFRKSMKMFEMHYFSLFFKSYLVLFLTFIMALRFYAGPLQILGFFGTVLEIFWIAFWEPYLGVDYSLLEWIGRTKGAFCVWGNGVPTLLF